MAAPSPSFPRPVPGSRAVLHIGLHKTATTHVQNTFDASRRHLARHGAVYPALGPGTGQHALLAPWVALAPGLIARTPAETLWAGLARHAVPGRTLLLSSEEFSRIAPRPVPLAEVRAHLAAFERVEVVCVLRDQVALLQSVWCEVARQGRAGHPFRLLADTLRSGVAFGVAINLRPLWLRLRQAFPADAIRFLDHAAAARAPGGVAGAVLAAAGFPGAVAGLKALPRANVSPDPLALWIARAGRPPREVVPPAAIAAAQAALDARFGPGRPQSLWTRAERATLATQMATRNAAFLEAAAAEGVTVTLSPPSAPRDDTLWRDDLGDLDPAPLPAGAVPNRG